MLPGRWMIRRSRLPTRLIIAATPGLPFSLVAGRNHPNAAVVRSSSTAGWHDPTVSLLPSARSRAHQILFAGASVLLAAACTTSSPSAPPAPVTETHPPSGPVPAGLERFYGQSLTWADCAPYATSQDAQEKDFGIKCVQRTEHGPEMLANLGTREVVKDMDVLRSVLGDRKLTYLGYSYGTRIGSAYAEAFPQNVRALVLDGAVDPTQ